MLIDLKKDLSNKYRNKNDNMIDSYWIYTYSWILEYWEDISNKNDSVYVENLKFRRTNKISEIIMGGNHSKNWWNV